MGLFENKKGLILGIANDSSIASIIAKEIMRQGGMIGVTHLPDRPDDEKKKNTMRVRKALKGFDDQVKFLTPLDVQDDANIQSVMDEAGREFGEIDFLLHSVAFASLDDLRVPTLGCSREGFKMAMDVSAYSLIAVANAAQSILREDSAITCMTYYGGEKVVPGYNMMGVCKAALESITKYLAYDLGPSKIRVNALSAGPVKTLAGVAAGVREMLALYDGMAPLGRNISESEIANTGAFLLSEMSNGITGEVMHLDCGYNIMGSPGRLTEQIDVGK
ncbi:MAG: enoyl-ACP reductase [Pirellulaceae bacterium]|jgi:enoyl-[acyl-carrier protein] reductase I|nr:enoyl-ACP reductase [Mariniblastus sp.]MDB4756730.1 enoyl-ACP reductase [Mariniblastus sp.]MDG2470482.1 enoyl-ACP reductase [Pirellulaceae bacterium]